MCTLTTGKSGTLSVKRVKSSARALVMVFACSKCKLRSKYLVASRENRQMRACLGDVLETAEENQ